MKYILYRSLGNLDNQVKKHELVAVEYGSDIYEVTDALVRDVTDDLAEIPPPFWLEHSGVSMLETFGDRKSVV